MAGIFQRAFPHGEDFEGIAGGDSSDILKPRAMPVPGDQGDFTSTPAAPPGEGSGGYTEPTENDEIENQALALATGLPEDEHEESEIDFLALVREAQESQAGPLHGSRSTASAWSQSLSRGPQRALCWLKVFTTPEWRGRSQDVSARRRARPCAEGSGRGCSASMFNTIDAITCVPGNESRILDPARRRGR
jgi:hypothetical protein